MIRAAGRPVTVVGDYAVVLEEPKPKRPPEKKRKYKITPELFDTTRIEEERDESIPHLVEHTDWHTLLFGMSKPALQETIKWLEYLTYHAATTKQEINALQTSVKVARRAIEALP